MLKQKSNGFSAYKVICLFLIFSLVISYLTVTYAADPQTLNVNISTESGKPGDTVKIAINFQGVLSPGINNFDFKLGYNQNICELVSVNPGGILRNPNANFSISSMTGGEIQLVYIDSTQGANAIVSDGLCSEIVLKIRDNAAPGSYGVGVIQIGGFSNKDLNSIEPVFSSGAVVVIGNTVPTTPIISSTPVVSPVTVKPSSVVTPKPTKIVTPEPSKEVVMTTPIIVVDENPLLPAGVPADLVINLTSDKNIYTEDETISFKIRYLNRLNKAASNIVIKADIPENTTLVDSSGGTEKDNSVEWTIPSLADSKTGEIVYKVKVGQLSESQIITTNNVSISSNDNALINDDNKSSYRIMLYTNRLGQLQHKKYVSGYKDKTIKPDKEITRAEVSVMFANILNLDVSDSGKQEYNDVPSKHWAFKYINAVSKAGLFKGYKGNLFKPNDPITRAELATAISRSIGLNTVAPLEIHFTDIIGHWSCRYVEEVYRLKIVNGYKNNLFLPNNRIKRSEVMTMLNKMSFRGPLKGAVVPFTDLSQKHWAYGQIAESTLDHEYTVTPDGNETEVN